MSFVAFAILAFAPGAFWLWFFLKRNAYRPESKRVIAVTFFLGMLATLPAGIINTLFVDESLLDSDLSDLGSVALAMLFVVGPAEETSKFLAVRLYAFRSLYFDEPLKGLVYSTAASLGFASLENLIYVLQFGPEVMIVRAPLSTLSHVIFGAFWGYALGWQAQGGRRGAVAVLAGLACAALAHGLFNLTIFVFPLASVGLVALGLWWALRRYGWARRVSPFRYRRNYPRFACRTCGQHTSVASSQCIACGWPTGKPYGQLYCSHCGRANRGDAAFCIGCGDRLQMPSRRRGRF